MKKDRVYGTRKRVLVTGGSGFIGSHLCERLLNEGCEVLCVDNFFTGTRANIAHLLPNPHFELQRHDITFPLYVEVDEIYNLACPASPIHYQFDPVQATKTSMIGAINMFCYVEDLIDGLIRLMASASDFTGPVFDWLISQAGDLTCEQSKTSLSGTAFLYHTA